MADEKRNEALNFPGGTEEKFSNSPYISDFSNKVWSIQHFLLMQVIQNQQVVLKAAKKKKEKMEALVSEADERDNSETGNEVQGFKAEYFLLPKSTRDLTKIMFDGEPDAVGMLSSLDIAGPEQSVANENATDQVAARFSGDLKVAKGGTYTLFLRTEDVAALFIDGKRVIFNKNSGTDGARTIKKEFDLSEGAHDITVLYISNNDGQTLQLEWSGPDTQGERAPIGGPSVSHTHVMADETDDHGEDDGMDGHDHNTDGQDGHDNDTGGNDGHDHTTDEQDGHGEDESSGHSDDHGTNDDTDDTDDQDGHSEDESSGHSDDHGTNDETDDTDGHGEDEDTDHADDHGSDDETDGAHDQTDDHGGHDHGTDQPEIPLPTTPEEIEAFVAAVKAQDETAAHMHDSQKATEHGQLLDLVPRSEATHIAIGNGDWFDPDTWHNGEIPGENAKVLIPKGVTVTYDGESDASIFTVRVDGDLSFATDVDTKILVDTLVVSPSGRLEIGTEENPIEDGVNARIVIANNGDIDTNWDPTLLSRGVISHGQVEIHGADKTTYLKVSEAPMSGDTTIKLSEIPDGWQVGDTIVLTGTHKQGWTWSNELNGKEFIESEDEEVTITAINGDTITIDRPLVHDHDTPREDLFAIVANTSRNITFSSEDGEASEIHHRGHVMFMHNDDVDVRYAAFDDLGRTDKSRPAEHVSNLNPSDIEADTNIQARYSLHLHRTGTEDQENPAIALGNSISGNPGWGLVHHSSHANIIDNIAFDVFGASFVAEDGDETGIWWRNLAIKTEGIGYGDWSTKKGPDVLRDDVGRTGDGFFFAGRMVEASENIAANTNHGFVWMSRTTNLTPETTVRPLAEHTDHPDAFYGSETAHTVNQVPIQGFSDNEAFGTQVGLIVVKNQIHQNHDVRTIMDGFLNWETSYGVQLSYTSHYTLKDFDLIGTSNTAPVARPENGFTFAARVFDIVVNGLKVENFRNGINWDKRVEETWSDDDYGHILIDVELDGNTNDFVKFDPDRHTILSSDDLVEDRLDFDFTGDSTISKGENLVFDGIKTDSIGETDRQFEADQQTLKYYVQFKDLLESEGYYETSDGRKVVLVTDLVADRATGELLKMTHVVTLDLDEKELAYMNASFNGVIDLDSKAPVTKDDHATIDNENSIVIDVLANDFDPDGTELFVDGHTNPFKGDVTVLDDGTLLYTPFYEFEGTDSFDYWAADGFGNFTKATVIVDVFDFN